MLNLRKKILVAIDGSPQSDKAAEEAVRMAVGNQSQFKSRIYAMLVLPNAPTSTYTDFVPTAPVTESEKWDELRRRIFYVVEKCALENDVPLEMIVEYGEPGEKLIEFAKREQVDVIVIGSSGKGFIQRRLKGSVSHRVTCAAHCSVYIVRGWDPVMELRRGLPVDADSGKEAVKLLEGNPVKRNVVNWMTEENSKKHPCPDCTFCQWCSDDRCRLCLNNSGCCRRRKLSLAEQIALYDSLNPDSSPSEVQKEWP